MPDSGGEDVAQRIDDHRITAVGLPVAVGADPVDADHVRLVLDGPGQSSDRQWWRRLAGQLATTT